MGELGGEEGLADAADNPGLEHQADALQHGVERDAGLLGDGLEGAGLVAGDEVFGDGEDAGVDGVVVVSHVRGRWAGTFGEVGIFCNPPLAAEGRNVL